PPAICPASRGRWATSSRARCATVGRSASASVTTRPGTPTSPRASIRRSAGTTSSAPDRTMAPDAVGSTEGAAPAAPSEHSGSGLDLISLTKDFPGGTIAVDDVNLHVDHGEYVVLLGPSGCGKTTTLRMIGGHEFPTGGDILLDGHSLVGLPPHKRPTTTVFQHFALFPHRSVLDNVAFGLKMEKVQKEERRKRAMEALDMVGLTELSQRKPRALSGGQQQRVAL